MIGGKAMHGRYTVDRTPRHKFIQTRSKLSKEYVEMGHLMRLKSGSVISTKSRMRRME